jgi:type I restriction enzyme, R subunit
MPKEARARIKIDKLLEESGWRFFAESNRKANIELEGNVKIEGLGEDFEHTRTGFIDYLLLDDNEKPLCVLEAKSEAKDPLDGKEQARKYATSKGKNCRFIILSNGNLHYFWDLEQGNPTGISRFPKPEDLQTYAKYEPDPKTLIAEEVESDYIARSQRYDYDKDPRWKGIKDSGDYINELKLRFLRPYQLDAVHAIQGAVGEGKNRFLLEMATGTGKTMLAAALIKMFLRTHNARRVLFLVDRLELETQADKNFNDYLQNDFSSCIFKKNRDEWKHKDIVVTTIQSISYENKYLKLFSPTDFDLVISDEAHRSISGGGRAIFEYFLGYKLGLTATPKDYLKHVDRSTLGDEDPRELERRILLSTYETFGCSSGEPTYRYALNDGVHDKYLIPPVVLDCRTEITTELLSEQGYAVDTEKAEEEEAYTKTDFERKFFSPETNLIFARTFMENALRDPITNEIGKTICFCVSRKHAAKMTEILNKIAMEMFPGKYNSDFAVQITSNITGAQDKTTQFTNNNLNGRTRFLDDYVSSRTRVAVTVAMMTTGYDCPDLMNLCMMRPIFSATDFIQIKGRGTRKATFEYEGRFEGELRKITKEKTKYKLFDFFGNVEYFEKDFPYDEKIELPVEGKKPKKLEGEAEQPPGVYINENPDPLKTITTLFTDEHGLRIDREFGSRFVAEVKPDAELHEAWLDGDDAAQARIYQERYLDRPTMFYTLDKLRQAFGADHRISFQELSDYIFGNIRMKKQPELIFEEFDRYAQLGKVPANLYYEMRDFFQIYCGDEEARTAINKKDFTKFSDNPELFAALARLGKQQIEGASVYIKDNVPMNRFMV